MAGDAGRSAGALVGVFAEALQAGRRGSSTDSRQPMKTFSRSSPRVSSHSKSTKGGGAHSTAFQLSKAVNQTAAVELLPAPLLYRVH